MLDLDCKSSPPENPSAWKSSPLISDNFFRSQNDCLDTVQSPSRIKFRVSVSSLEFLYMQ